MRHLRKYLFSLVLLSLFARSYAGFTVSAGLHYRWVSDSTYEFTYVWYHWCVVGSTPAPGNFNFKIASASRNVSIEDTCYNCLISYNASTQPPQILNDLNNCSDYMYWTWPPYPSKMTTCFQEYIYRFQYTMPAKANDWTISIQNYFATCMFINALDNSIYLDMDYSECSLNNLDFPDSIGRNNSTIWLDRSPSIPGHLTDTFINSPIISVCNNRSYTLNQMAKEYDGDLVRYEFANHGFFSDTNEIKYRTPFSVSNLLPVNAPPPFIIDSITGIIIYEPVAYATQPLPILPHFNKTTSNPYYIPIVAREYRNDTTWVGGLPVVKRKQIGHITRFITIIATPDSLCADSNVTFADTANLKPITFLKLRCDDNPFRIAFNVPIRCSSVDTNGSSFLLLDSANGDTLSITKAETICRHDDITDFILIHTDSILEQGTYYLYIKTGDDGDAILTQCGKKMVPYMDTLLVLKTGSPPQEAFRSDSLGNIATDLEAKCRDTMMTVFTSYPVSCSSIEINGSDFYLVDSSGTSIIQVPITKAKAKNCKGGYTREITLTFSTLIEGGNYKLYLKEGTDNNSLIDACSRRWSNLINEVEVPLPPADLGADIEFCSRDVVDVDLTAPAGYVYKWSTGQTAQTIHIDSYGTYWLQVWTNTGCVSTDTINIKEIDCTGIEEENDAEIKIYPNPARDVVFIEYGGGSEYSIEILDAQGRIVLLGKGEGVKGKKESFNLPREMQGGLFLMRITSQNGSHSQRLVIEK